MATGHSPLRRAALLVSAAFAVHQLRFLVSYGHEAGHVLNEPGHRYLPFAAAAAAVLLLAGGVHFAATLVRYAAGRQAPDAAPPSLRRLWLQNAALLVAIYVAQEGLEGAFTPGHPIWAHGGWTVLPLAALLGGIVALLLVGAHRVLVEAARRVPARHPGRGLEGATAPPSPAVLAPIDALARHLAGRAPPHVAHAGIA